MNTPSSLVRLRQHILNLLVSESRHIPLSGLGLFHARCAQALRAVPIHQPTVVLILGGHKELVAGERLIHATSGDLLLLPASHELSFANHPAPNAPYLAVMVSFLPAAVERFSQTYGASLQVWDQPPIWHGQVSEAVLLAFTQWVELACGTSLSAELLLHRQIELLLLLTQAGLVGNLLLARQSSWRQRVSALLALAPAHPWEAAEVARRLGVGESSLRRHLRGEESGFRGLLEEVRLVAGLGLLQETFWPIARVAAEVGYDSHSRFSERFRRRFGVTPSELRRTRWSDDGEQMSVSGELSGVDGHNLLAP